METTNKITSTWILELEELVLTFVSKYEPERYENRYSNSFLTEEILGEYWEDEDTEYNGTMEDYLEEHKSLLEEYYSELIEQKENELNNKIEREINDYNETVETFTKSLNEANDKLNKINNMINSEEKELLKENLVNDTDYLMRDYRRELSIITENINKLLKELKAIDKQYDITNLKATRKQIRDLLYSTADNFNFIIL